MKRQRATKAEHEARLATLYAIVDEMKPMTVRQTFYQAVVHGLIDKSEHGYAKIAHDLTLMRRSGVLPWAWLTDHTRWVRQPTTWADPADALRETARLYRKTLWADAAVQLEIWLEKDALSGVVMPITSDFDVPLMVARGYASLSYLHAAAEQIVADGRPAHIYQLGDHDPSGIDAACKIERELRGFAPGVKIHFERLAVTRAQIRRWRLPTRPTKQSDSRAAKFRGESVELDAIRPDRLRDLVRTAIERHLPRRQYDVLKAAEQSERQAMAQIAATIGGEE